MGVSGLMRYVLDSKVDLCLFVNLADIALKYQSELLVDFYAFEHYILSNFFSRLSKCSQNPYLKLLGGEYGALDAFVSKVISDLRQLGLELIFFIDGGKGSSRQARSKFHEWKNRHFNDLKRLSVLMDAAKYSENVCQIPKDTWTRPVLLEVQVLHTLRRCNCEIVQVSSGEADFVLYEALQSRPKAYAILSNDSDFCIFENCTFIPIDLFDINHDIFDESPDDWLPKAPHRLMCGTIASENLASLLGVTAFSMTA